MGGPLSRWNPDKDHRTSDLDVCASRAIEHMPEQMGSVGGRGTSYDTERDRRRHEGGAASPEEGW